MTVEHSVTVRFAEVDSAGFIFFSRLFEYCHATYEELIGRLSPGSFGEVFSRSGWGTPVVHAEADFERPIRLGDTLTLSLTVGRIGETSMTVDYVITGTDADDVRARARLVHAFIDMNTLQPITVPADVRAGLERLGVITEKPA